MSNTEIIVRFNAVWETFDVDAILSFFAEGATFDMGAHTESHGPRRDSQSCGVDHPSAHVGKVEILHSAEDATGRVMNERIDRFLRRDGKWVSIGVMGVHELANGKITAHRDYFDMKTMRDQMADYVPPKT